MNTAERALSTDINRLQAMQSAGLLEFLRFMLDVDGSSDDVNAGGYSVENVTTGNPMDGAVIAGICVIPQIGTLNLGVTDGLALVINPDASPSADDSVYKYVRDGGGMPICFETSGGGALAMTANASGFPRIDVVECQRVDDPSPETDSRDVFNPTTGLFTATTVQKTVDSTFQYRVRAGTPNGGFPGTASGWMPLCVALVPTGSTTCDSMTFWDVRNMIRDRIFGSAPVEVDLPRRGRSLMHSVNKGGGTSHFVGGVVEVEGGQKRIGGQIRRGSPGTDFGLAQVDFSDAANQDATLNISGSSGLAFYYLVTPFGLPRWARYTDVAAGLRAPRSPRGIHLLSTVPPSHVYGIATAPITFPSAFGFNGATTTEAVCWGATTYSSGTLSVQCTSDGWTDLQLATPAVNGSATAVSGTWTLVENTHFPAGATRLKVQVHLLIGATSAAAATSLCPVGVDLITGCVGFVTEQFSQSTADTQIITAPDTSQIPFTQDVFWTLEVSLPNEYPNLTTPRSYTVGYTLAPGGVLATHFTVNAAPTVQVLAWKM
jgi:hypothetical protein